MLRVFLRSRGNMREVEKHLGVSYPTARLRVSQLLDKLGLADEPEPPPLNREQILSEVAAGALTPAEAQRLLGELRLTPRPPLHMGNRHFARHVRHVRSWIPMYAWESWDRWDSPVRGGRARRRRW